MVVGRPLLNELNVRLGEEQFDHLVGNIIEKGDGQDGGPADSIALLQG